MPNPSQREVWTKTSARSSQSRISVRPGSATRAVEPERRLRGARVSASSGPLPRIASRASGSSLRTRAKARSSVA